MKIGRNTALQVLGLSYIDNGTFFVVELIAAGSLGHSKDFAPAML